MKVELLSMVSGTSPAVHASMSRILESPAAGKQPDHRVPGRRAGRRHRSLGEFGHAAKAYDPPENLVSIGFQRIRRGLPLHGPSNRLHRKPNKTGGSSDSRAEPSEIAAILNERGFRPGASARPGRANDRFSTKHVAYLMHAYGLRSRYDRLRQRGMLNKKEMADRLGVHEQTVDRWAEHGLIKAHFYNDHGWQLYEPPGPNTPAKHCSRWDRLVDRAAGLPVGLQNTGLELKEV